MKKFTKNMIGMFLILFCAGVFSGGITVNAEESDADVQKYIYREASGEMEELIGIRISDEEEERLLEQQQASAIQWSGNTVERCVWTAVRIMAIRIWQSVRTVRTASMFIVKWRKPAGNLH